MDLLSINRSAPATTIEDVFKNINTLFTSIGIIPVWGNHIENTMELSYLGYTIILTILWFISRNDSNKIVIRIYPTDRSYDLDLPEDEEKLCLDINIMYDNQQQVVNAYIAQIAIDKKCQIPQTKGGPWLVNFAKKFLCVIGVRHSHLDDQSHLTCDGSTNSGSLILLRSFQGIYDSWYSKFGFKPKNTSNLPNAMMKLHDYPAKSIFTEAFKVGRWNKMKLLISWSNIHHLIKI